MSSFPALKKQIEHGQFAPVYYLYGEESWFIDMLAQAVEKHALQPHEEAFNKEVCFGADTTANAVMTACRSFPMMASRRLVMLKEAHRLPKSEWDKLLHYFSQARALPPCLSYTKAKKAVLAKRVSKLWRKLAVFHFIQKSFTSAM
ncbi:MAG: hypothetical protein R3B47_10505 [Bacteroidia bacterium]